MSAIMIVMIVVMVVAIFGSDHRGIIGHGGATDTEQARRCDQRDQPDCPPQSGQPRQTELNEQGKSGEQQ